jgi:adenylate cyclase
MTAWSANTFNSAICFSVCGRTSILHSGPVMAGVIGTRKFAYDVWGDTVNIAARMEAASQPNRVLASAATVKGLGSDCSFDGPHKIDTKEGRVVEAFFLSRQP